MPEQEKVVLIGVSLADSGEEIGTVVVKASTEPVVGDKITAFVDGREQRVVICRIGETSPAKQQ